jgi:hypothetical protein
MNDKFDLLLKVVLTLAFIYFSGHVIVALADTNQPLPPTIRCIPAGQGGMTCFPI